MTELVTFLFCALAFGFGLYAIVNWLKQLKDEQHRDK